MYVYVRVVVTTMFFYVCVMGMMRRSGHCHFVIVLGALLPARILNGGKYGEMTKLSLNLRGNGMYVHAGVTFYPAMLSRWCAFVQPTSTSIDFLISIAIKVTVPIMPDPLVILQAYIVHDENSLQGTNSSSCFNQRTWRIKAGLNEKNTVLNLSIKYNFSKAYEASIKSFNIDRSLYHIHDRVQIHSPVHAVEARLIPINLQNHQSFSLRCRIFYLPIQLHVKLQRGESEGSFPFQLAPHPCPGPDQHLLGVRPCTFDNESHGNILAPVKLSNKSLKNPSFI